MNPRNTETPATHRFATLRARMVEEQLRARGIRDERVLEAMGHIPRERFVPAPQRERAYTDAALPIGFGQTISQPFMVARTLELLHLEGPERVLEVGAGSGYQAALLGWLARDVVALERIAPLADRAAEAIASLGMEHVQVLHADGSLGWPPRAPYDAIAVAAAAPRVPTALLDQLAPGGRLVMPVGPPRMQRLRRVVREPDGRIRSEAFDACVFVPLREGVERME